MSRVDYGGRRAIPRLAAMRAVEFVRRRLPAALSGSPSAPSAPAPLDGARLYVIIVYGVLHMIDAHKAHAILKPDGLFRPVRIVMDDGKRYSVRFREQTLVSPTDVVYGRSRSGRMPFDRIVYLPLERITRIESAIRSRLSNSRTPKRRS